MLLKQLIAQLIDMELDFPDYVCKVRDENGDYGPINEIHMPGDTDEIRFDTWTHDPIGDREAYEAHSNERDET